MTPEGALWEEDIADDVALWDVSHLLPRLAWKHYRVQPERPITKLFVHHSGRLGQLYYEGAEASFELLVRRTQPGYTSPFELVDFVNIVEKRSGNGHPADIRSQVMLKVKVGDEVMHTASEGNGPVNSLDNALRKALLQFYPSLEAIRLVDYKVRVVDQGSSTGAVVRVLIESTDGRRTWSTVGSSENIIEASWTALADSLEYWLVRERVGAAV